MRVSVYFLPIPTDIFFSCERAHINEILYKQYIFFIFHRPFRGRVICMENIIQTSEGQRTLVLFF
jgi:hypothetical protein